MTTDETATRSGSGTGPLPFDTTKAHQARIYDYLLGGKDNYAVDRAAADAALEAWPELGFAAQANRAFLSRVVRYLAVDAGIRQFLDLGTGIPTAGNLHEVAQAIAPESRVVYVDYDPIVLAHARALLDSNEAGATEYIDADLRDTGTILTQAAQVLDFTKPVAVTMLTILHVVPESDNPRAIVARLLDAVPPGSCLAISHASSDLFDPETAERFKGVLDRTLRQQYTPRNRDQMEQFFAGMDLVEPGLVPVEEWRSEPGHGDARKSYMWSAVGRKR